jgi:hypothetical protein
MLLPIFVVVVVAAKQGHLRLPPYINSRQQNEEGQLQKFNKRQKPSGHVVQHGF